MARARREFTAVGFLVRWVAALIIVVATYNPLKYSFYHWVMQSEGAIPIKVLLGIVLLIVYAIFLRATWRSIGATGLVLVLALFAAMLWVFIYYDWINLSEPSHFAWVALVVLASIMAVGLSWSHMRRRLTGQIDTDVVDDSGM